MPKKEATQIQFVPLFFAFSFGMLLSNLLAENKPQVREDSTYELAYRGLDKTRDELPNEIARQLETAEKDYLQKRQDLLERAGLRFHLHDYAQLHQLDLDAAAEALFDIEAVSEEEIVDYFQSHKDKIDKPFYEVREAIAATLGRRKAELLRRQRLDELMASGDLILYLN